MATNAAKVTRSSLQKELQKLIKEWLQSELPMNKRRKRRNGQGAPISAWMAGACSKSNSKIVEVCEGRAKFPYKQWGHASKALAQRIANKYQTTWIQHALITSYVFTQYRGRVSGFLNTGGPSPFQDELSKSNTSPKVLNTLEDACEKLKIHLYDIPLGALIDARMTNILLMIELISTAERQLWTRIK